MILDLLLFSVAFVGRIIEKKETIILVMDYFFLRESFVYVVVKLGYLVEVVL